MVRCFERVQSSYRHLQGVIAHWYPRARAVVRRSTLVWGLYTFIVNWDPANGSLFRAYRGRFLLWDQLR